MLLLRIVFTVSAMIVSEVTQSTTATLDFAISSQDRKGTLTAAPRPRCPPACLQSSIHQSRLHRPLVERHHRYGLKSNIGWYEPLSIQSLIKESHWAQLSRPRLIHRPEKSSKLYLQRVQRRLPMDNLYSF